MDNRIEKEIYKELSRIMMQDIQCECEVVKVKLEEKSIFSLDFNYGNEHLIDSGLQAVLFYKDYGGAKTIHGSYADKMWAEYNLLYEKYKDGDVMKVLFVSKKNKERFEAWYNYMDVVKKHRKIIIACDSPLDFCHKFDADKMGAAYTTFYFDKDLGPADICERVNELKHHYGVEDFKYIIENKLRKISIDDMLETNDMSKFEKLYIHNDIVAESDKKSADEKPEITKEMYDSLEARVVELERVNKEYEWKIEKLEERANEDSDYIIKWMDDVDKRFDAIKKAVNDI